MALLQATVQTIRLPGEAEIHGLPLAEAHYQAFMQAHLQALKELAVPRIRDRMPKRSGALRRSIDLVIRNGNELRLTYLWYGSFYRLFRITGEEIRRALPAARTIAIQAARAVVQ